MSVWFVLNWYIIILDTRIKSDKSSPVSLDTNFNHGDRKMNDFLDELEADVNAGPSKESVNQVGLSTIAELAVAIRTSEDDIANLENLLKEKRELLKLTDEDLPSMLQEIGLSEFKLGTVPKSQSNRLMGHQLK